jgi:hypothetical protein
METVIISAVQKTNYNGIIDLRWSNKGEIEVCYSPFPFCRKSQASMGDEMAGLNEFLIIIYPIAFP